LVDLFEALRQSESVPARVPSALGAGVEVFVCFLFLAGMFVSPLIQVLGIAQLNTTLSVGCDHVD
jgi:hypothetical protein